MIRFKVHDFSLITVCIKRWNFSGIECSLGSRMHLKVVILVGLLLCAVSSAPRRHDEGGSRNYVMIGNSNEGLKVDDEKKNHRSGYPFPIMLHNRPSSSYQFQGGFNGYNGQNGGSSSIPQSSLISAHVHLLEPFMLFTFLLFVLTLIDKAQIRPMISRNDVVQENSMNYTNTDPSGGDLYQYQFLKMLEKHNGSNF